jgi:regulator of protease activity HflC (stomatin/prohibitin superfamily)
MTKEGYSMIGTIIAGFLILAGVFSFITSRTAKDRDVKSGGAVVGAVLLVMGILLTLFKMTFYVSATEVGVPVTLGKVGPSVSSGFHLKNPLTNIITLPVRPYTLPEDITVSARTSQGGNVSAKYGARWQVDKNEAGNVYLQVRTGDEEKISKDLVEKSLATAVGNVYVKYDNATATTARVEAETAVLTEVNRLLDPYGVNVTQVFLRQVDPDEKTKDSLNRLSASKNETLIAQQNVQTATAQAQAAAEAAKGAKSATDQIPQNLTPAQVTLYCAQLWADAQAAATAKGVTLWTTPCGSATAPTPIVSQK